MLLTFDIGNTSIKIGLFKDNELICKSFHAQKHLLAYPFQFQLFEGLGKSLLLQSFDYCKGIITMTIVRYVI